MIHTSNTHMPTKCFNSLVSNLGSHISCIVHLILFKTVRILKNLEDSRVGNIVKVFQTHEMLFDSSIRNFHLPSQNHSDICGFIWLILNNLDSLRQSQDRVYVQKSTIYTFQVFLLSIYRLSRKSTLASPVVFTLIQTYVLEPLCFFKLLK